MLNPSTTHPHFSVPWPSHLAGGSGAGALGHPAACRGPGGPITSISTPHPATKRAVFPLAEIALP